ncbi:MAG: hypothetical protein QW666_01790 [Candidatus Woesearchaeota archaeon]
MRKIMLLLAILLIVVSCAKEEQIQPQPVGPVCGNNIIEQGEQCDPPGPECSLFCQIISTQPPVTPPVQPPVQPPVTPPVTPKPNVSQPPAIVSNLPECSILNKNGHIYTEANVGGVYIPGQQITNEQSEDLSVCYPYFSKAAATTSSVCCVI